MQIMPTISSLLRGNRGLSQDAGQSRVMIRLQSPAPRWLVSEFMRLRLTPEMLSGGEPVKDIHRHWAHIVGVTGIEIAPEWIPNFDAPQAEHLVTQFMLVLDRRYRDVVLAAVYRTAGMLGESLGVRIK